MGSLSIAKSYIDLSNNFDVLYVNTAVVVFTHYVTIEQFYGGPYEISSTVVSAESTVVSRRVADSPRKLDRLISFSLNRI